MDKFTPAQLAIVVQEAMIRKDSFFLRMFFGETYTFETKKVDLDIIPHKIKIAPFCSPLIGGTIERNQGFATTSFEPGYVKSKHAVTSAQATKRRPGEAFAGTMSPADRINAQIMQNLERQEEAIQYREEWMATQMVLKGAYMVEGPNIVEPYEISAGRRPENNVTLVSSARWSQLNVDTHDIVSDIEEYAELCDGEVNIMALDTKAWSLLRKFKSFKDALETRRGSMSEIETTLKDLGKAVSFKGFLGDVGIWVVNEEYTARDGSTQKQMSDNTMVLGHTSNRGLRLYGAIQDMSAQEEGMHESDRYSKDWTEGQDPKIRYTKTESAPAPYLADVNHFAVITVD